MLIIYAILILGLLCLGLISGKSNQLILLQGLHFLNLLIVYRKFSLKISVRYLLSPSIVSVLYFSILFLMGSWAYDKSLILNQSETTSIYFEYYLIEYGVILLLINSTLILTANRLLRVNLVMIEKTHGRSKFIRDLFISIILVGIIEALKFLAMIDNGLIEIPKYVLFINILKKSLQHKNNLNFTFFSIFYICQGLLFQIDSKREILLFLLVAFFIWITYNRTSFRRIFILGTSTIIISFIIIMTSSILRGWGKTEANNQFEAIKELPQLLNSENLVFILNNLEFTASFRDGLNAYAHSNEYIVNYNIIGRTALFLFPSRLFMIQKPQSIIDAYTSFYYPSLRKIGKSRSTTALTEFFWGIGPVFGAIIYIAVLILVEFLLDSFLLKKSESLILFSIFFMLIYLRGSGIDLFLQYLTIYFVFKIFLSLKFSNASFIHNS